VGFSKSRAVRLDGETLSRVRRRCSWGSLLRRSSEELGCQLPCLHTYVFDKNFKANLLIPAWTLLIPPNYFQSWSNRRMVETWRHLMLDGRRLALPGSPVYDLLFQEHQRRWQKP
jgi:hypothetical protein